MYHGTFSYGYRCCHNNSLHVIAQHIFAADENIDLSNLLNASTDGFSARRTGFDGSRNILRSRQSMPRDVRRQKSLGPLKNENIISLRRAFSHDPAAMVSDMNEGSDGEFLLHFFSLIFNLTSSN